MYSSADHSKKQERSIIHRFLASVVRPLYNKIMGKYRSSLRAFTLIELLIVIVIIGILVSISLSTFRTTQIKARDVQRKSQVLKIQSSLESYKAVNNVYGPDYGVAAGVAGGLTASCSAATQLGGYYIVSTDTSATRDPLFVVDATSANTTATSGYLLKFMERPNYVKASAATDSFDTGETLSSCAVADQSTYTLSTGRINYAVYAGQYWVYVILENKNEHRTPASAHCYHRLDGQTVVGGVTYPATEFDDIAFPAFTGYPTSPSSTCDSQIKIFARGSLAQPSQ